MRLALLISCLVALAACQPKVGDSCDVDSDCSRTGERICDSTQPGGYCTVFGCDPTSCPDDESVCISFGNVMTTAGGCDGSGSVSPYARNFCMARCGGDGDCRGGYVCVDMAAENPWGADVVTSDPGSTKVCVRPYSGAPLPNGQPSEYCTNTSTPTLPSFGGASAGGAGGMSGADGAP